MVEELKLQHQFEIKTLRAEMERMKAEQRRLKDDVNSVRTLSNTSKLSGFGEDFRSAEKVARRAIPAEIFYGLPPRHTYHGELYFINSLYKIILYTDASDYAHDAYLCQIRPATKTSEEIEEPIRFRSGSFSGAQT
jgi:hypothetical protein